MKRTFLSLALLLTILIFFHSVFSASSLEIDITSDKSTYNLGDYATVNGNLTSGGSMVPDGLVTVRMNNPRSETTLVRTLTTGSEPPEPWPIEINEFFPCDASGNPQSSSNLGGRIGFQITITNNVLSGYSVDVVLSLQYSNGVPYMSFVMYEGFLEAHQNVTVVHWPISILYDAPLGTTTAYASALADVTTSSGYAYCPENVTTFEITSQLLSGASTPDQGGITSSANGAFDLAYATSPHGGMLGNYTAYAISKYSYWIATNQTTFTVKLVTDITGRYNVSDGKVDIMDLALVSSCYGSYPGHPKWDPRADISGDEKVDIQDVARVSADYGKYGTLP